MSRFHTRYGRAGLVASGLVAGLAVCWRWGGPTDALLAAEERTSPPAGPEEEGWPLSLFFAQLAREKPIELQPDALPDSEEGQKELGRACLRRNQGAGATALFQQIAEKYQGQQPGLLALHELSKVHRYESTRLEWVDERVAAQLRLAEAYPAAPTAPQMLGRTVSDLVEVYRKWIREDQPDGTVRHHYAIGSPSPQHWRTLLEALARLLGCYPESRYSRAALEKTGQLLAGRPETASQARELAEWARARYPQDADFGARMDLVVAASLETEGNLAEAVRRLNTAFQSSAGLIRDGTTRSLHGQLEGIVRTHPEIRPPEPTPTGAVLLERPAWENAPAFVLLDGSPTVRRISEGSGGWLGPTSSPVPLEAPKPEKCYIYPLRCGVEGVAAWFNHCEFENTDQPTRELLPGVVLNVQGRPVCSRALSLLLTPSFPVSEGDTIFCPGVLWFRQTARRVGDLVEVTLRANEDLVVRQVWRPGEFWWREATWEFRATLLVGFSAAGIDAYDVRGDPGDPPRQTFRLTARRLPDESLGTPSIAPDAIREGFNTVEFWGLDEVLFDPLAECLKHLLSPVDVSAYLGKLEAARHRQTCSYGRPSPRPEKPSLEQLAELAAQRLDPHSDEGIRANSLLADAFLAAGRFEEAAERYRHLDAARDQSEAKEWEIRHLLSRPFEGSWAQALVSLGRQEESVQLLRRTQQKRLLYTTEGLLLADTLFELKDYQAAAAAYAALPVTGNAVGARRLLREGLAWVGSATPSQRDGDTFRAQRAWRECVRFFSDLPEATEARSRADAQAEMDALLATRREEKPWEDFGLRAQWDYAASGLLEGGHITGQVVLDREGAPEILIQTYEGNKGYTCYAMDPTGRTLQPADKDRFQAAFDALRRPYQQALRKREVHRAEDFVLWQEAETLTLTAPDGQVRWSYTADTELDLQDQRADPGIPLLVGVTVTRLAGETVIVLGVQQRTVSIGMGLNYFPVSGDVRCLGLDGKERWRTKTVAGEEALVVAPPHSDQPMVYVLGKVPGPLLRWHVACVWECFDLASGRSLWRIDLPSAFRTDSGRGQTRRLESLEFSPAEPGREILVQAGRALGVYSARGQRLYEETKQVVFYAASARLRGDTDQVVCMLGEASTGPTTLVVLGPGGQVYWQRNDDRLALYNAASQIHLADLDGDGGEEIVTFDSETVSVFGFRG